MFVLLLLAVLTLLAAAVMQSTYYDNFTMSSAQLQSEAAINSMAGAQEGLARLRAYAINTSLLPFCQSADTCPATPTPVVLDDGNRYRVTIFRRGWPRTYGAALNFGLSGDQTPMVVVSSLGRAYSGSSVFGTKLTSLTEVEVQPPDGSGGSGSGTGGGNEKPGG